MQNVDLSGRTALVTGAARGIGAATARALAARGAYTLVTDVLDASPLVQEIEAEGGRAAAHTLDVRDKAACERLMTSLHSEGASIDILVCNAGVCPPGEPIGSDEQWQHVIDVNLNGTRNSVAAVWENMRSRGAGCIVIVSSMAFLSRRRHRRHRVLRV